MPLIQLVYISSADHEMEDAELDAILAASIRHNAQQNITGMLLYSSGTFMQALEGEAAALDETYARISADPRHHDLQMIYREEITARDFPHWSMGFRRLGAQDASAHPAYADYFATGFGALQCSRNDGLALELLKQFAER